MPWSSSASAWRNPDSASFKTAGVPNGDPWRRSLAWRTGGLPAGSGVPNFSRGDEEQTIGQYASVTVPTHRDYSWATEAGNGSPASKLRSLLGPRFAGQAPVRSADGRWSLVVAAVDADKADAAFLNSLGTAKEHIRLVRARYPLTQLRSWAALASSELNLWRRDHPSMTGEAYVRVDIHDNTVEVGLTTPPQELVRRLAEVLPEVRVIEASGHAELDNQCQN